MNALKTMAIFVVVCWLNLDTVSQAVPLNDQGKIFQTGGVLELGTDEWSQSITTGIPGQLSKIQIQFHNGVPTPAQPLTLSIFDGGNPTSSPALFSEQLFLTSADLDNDQVYSWGLGGADLSFDVGDVFSFRLQADQAGFAGFDIAGDHNGYVGGVLFKNQVPSTELSDIGFKTFVKPSTQIRLATDKGTFVIRSSEPGIKVVIAKSGKKVEQIEVERGNKTVKVRAGEYEVELTVSVTGIQAKGGQFTLTHRNRVVLEIFQEGHAQHTRRRRHDPGRDR